jgi:hypothetical protein
MEYTKSVVEPIKQVAPRSRLRGMFDDYNHINAKVLVLAGETHLNRKPVSTSLMPLVLALERCLREGWRSVRLSRTADPFHFNCLAQDASYSCYPSLGHETSRAYGKDCWR